MDNETGNEVVWNEVQFSERKNFREQEEKLRSVFDNLTQLVHINLVKFHKYWTDTKSEKPRMIFITEYMSSGSMSRFLQRARSSGTLLNIKAWKKWTTQILSALNYLHSCDPPIVHANLTCNTVFIQQNGLIKIGCVAPNAIHHHVKTFRENLKNMHYVAPEFDQLSEATTETDIYSFGICALEMATTGGLCCNGSAETNTHVTPAMIRKAIDGLEDVKQRDFIEICLDSDPKKRPTARELLFHQALFEVHSLKLLAAHAIVNSKLIDHLGEEDLRVQDSTRIVATSHYKQLAYCELSTFQIDLDKFLEDVKNGIYPLIAF
ncbi:UNVERIFIED_CONTAM: Nuclear receptor-binding protein, partial [Eudyptes robustus]